jgi:hypothetical protein
MTEAPHISLVCGSGGAVADVIFVHGLTGDPYETWATGAEKEYWPKWLCAEFPGVAIYAVGYPASLFEKWAKKEMNLHERANNLLEQLAAYGFGERPIAFICHSLGGLLVKEILRTSKECSDEGWRLISAKTRLTAFLATPHTGASLASAIKLIAPRLSSTFVDLLSNDSGYLTNLNQAYRDLAQSSGLSTISYYEKWKTRDVSIVVSPESADPGVGQTRPIAVDADHISICKPKDRNALIYISLCRHLKTLIKRCQADHAPESSSVFDADDYATASETDRRDLLQKLIDAGREHEYQTANDYQNKFAQRYYRLGLFTESKQKSDELLSIVHQRFVTHVYSAKICRQASDDEIACALQTHVIDALCVEGGIKHKASATAILQALYFLTEQCYIRWDAP